MPSATHKPRPKTDPLALAAEVSQRIENLGVRLIQAECVLTPPATTGRLSVDLRYAVDTNVNRKEEILSVAPTFTMTAAREDMDSKEPVVAVKAKFLLLYRVTSLKGLRKEHFARFGELNGIYNAWPYWREYLQATIARMGLPVFPVPVFRISAHRPHARGKKTSSKTTRTREASGTR